MHFGVSKKNLTCENCTKKGSYLYFYHFFSASFSSHYFWKEIFRSLCSYRNQLSWWSKIYKKSRWIAAGSALFWDLEIIWILKRLDSGLKWHRETATFTHTKEICLITIFIHHSRNAHFQGAWEYKPLSF